jgi:hypothetical protein
MRKLRREGCTMRKLRREGCTMRKLRREGCTMRKLRREGCVMRSVARFFRPTRSRDTGRSTDFIGNHHPAEERPQFDVGFLKVC